MVNAAHGARVARLVVVVDFLPCGVRERNQDWLLTAFDIQDVSVADLMKLDRAQFWYHRDCYKVA